MGVSSLLAVESVLWFADLEVSGSDSWVPLSSAFSGPLESCTWDDVGCAQSSSLSVGANTWALGLL